jgi:hypothetical protein
MSSGTIRASTSAAVRIGFSKTGPGTKSRAIPIGSMGVRMSEKRIAASTLRRSIG